MFVSHAAIIGFLPPVLGHGFGQVGVMIFFVLSGFLMAHLYLRRPFTRKTVAASALARAGRALCLVRAPYELWTIPVEIQFYAVFPIFWCLYTRGWRFRLIPLAVLVALSTVLTIALYREKLIMLPTYSFAFFIGVFTSVYLDRIKSIVMDRLPFWAGAIFLVLVLVDLPELRMSHGLALSRTEYWVSIWLDPVTWLFVYGLFLACLAGSSSMNIFKSSVSNFLGRISYGFYLIHYPVLMIVDDVFGHGIFGFVIALMTTVLISAVSYSAFEKPVMIWIRGLQKLETGAPNIRP